MPDAFDALVTEIAELIRAAEGSHQDPDVAIVALLNEFATQVATRILPDDPASQAQVIHKAQALGIDIGGAEHAKGNVIDLLGWLRRRRADLPRSQRDNAARIGQALRDLQNVAAMDGLSMVAHLIEMAALEADVAAAQPQ